MKRVRIVFRNGEEVTITNVDEVSVNSSTLILHGFGQTSYINLDNTAIITTRDDESEKQPDIEPEADDRIKGDL